MQPLRIAGRGLYCVCKGVAQIEERTVCVLPLIAPDDLRLDLTRAADHVGEGCWIAREKLVQVCLQPAEKRRITDEAVLDDLGKAGPELPGGERREGSGIRQHDGRLMEGANQILAARVVDAGLASNRGIHLRQEGRWHLSIGDAPLIARRREPGHIAHNSAAQGDHRAVPAEAVGHQHVEESRDVRECLVGFAVWQDGFNDVPRAQAL